MLIVTHASFTDFNASASGLLNLSRFFVDEGSGNVLCCHLSAGSGIVHRFEGAQVQTHAWFLTATKVDGLNL